jgi:hypothetical protein
MGLTAKMAARCTAVALAEVALGSGLEGRLARSIKLRAWLRASPVK